MPYWCAAQLQPQRDGLALYCLRQAGFETYAPRLREPRTAHGRKVVRTPLLFPGYLFVFIRLQWHADRWAPGVVRLVMNGVGPAAVPEAVIEDRDRLRVIHGPFAGHVGLYAGMKPHERVEVLLAILGGSQRVTLAADSVEQAS